MVPPIRGVGCLLCAGAVVLRGACRCAQPRAPGLRRGGERAAAGTGAAFLAYAGGRAPPAARARRRRARGARRLGLQRRRGGTAKIARTGTQGTITMLGRLMPREGKFFDLFNSHAERIVEGSRRSEERRVG